MDQEPVHQRLEELHERGALERGRIESTGGYLVDSRGLVDRRRALLQN